MEISSISGGDASEKNAADIMRNRTGSSTPDHSPCRAKALSAEDNNIRSSKGLTTSSHNTIRDMKTSSATRSGNNMSLLFSPRGKAVMSMSFALAIHLGGYELSRASVMSLFTSDGLGFGKKDKNQESELSALPMAVGCVSPFAVALVWFYGKTLSHGGPNYALKTHTLICAAAQIVAGVILRMFDQCLDAADGADENEAVCSLGSVGNVKRMSQVLLFLLFVFQSAYVQLLYAQHWAFISSVLTAEEGSRLFAPIAGLGSIGSTLAAGSVSLLVESVGLIGLMYMAGISYIVCAILANIAFSTAKSHGFEPSSSGKIEKNEDSQSTISSSASDGRGAYAPINNGTKDSPTSTVTNATLPCLKKNNIFQQAYSLFHRVPVLGALFVEVIVSQCLSSLVNYIYLYKLKVTITDDSERAGWSGKFYAWINGVSGIFQFFIIPILLKHCEAHRIWLFMPSLMLICTLYQFGTYKTSELFGASASFFCIKTMEYSLRGAANEMLYVSLDYESRYLGKKVISLIAGKFGKSSMAVALAFSVIMYGHNDNLMWYLLATATIFTFLWLFSSIRLHSLIEASKR
jgi:ATP/ADP translocase